MKFAITLLAVLPLFAQQDFDVVVYGGTAGGFATALSAARHGQKTILLEPRTHVGGMATGGLSRTDVGKREVIGGLSLEFYYRVGLRYEMNRYLNPVAWFYEPKIGEEVMLTMLKEAGVVVRLRQRLKERDGVRKDGTRITEITMEDGTRIRGKIFADCTYEGDLMAQTKVSYTWGRESEAQYGETLAGVRDRTPYHQFLVDVSPYGTDGKLLPEISTEKVAPPGSADKKVQAYNFRMTATNVAANRLPWPKPNGYDPKRYELLARLLEANAKKLGRAPVFHELTLIAPIPNGKADFNNNGPLNTKDFSPNSFGKIAVGFK